MSTKTPEPILLPVLPGSLSDADKEKLSAAGIVVIEHPDPSSIRLIRPGQEVSGSTLLSHAMSALANGDTNGQRENRELFTRLLAGTLTRTPEK
jgi:hypothetical protein